MQALTTAPFPAQCRVSGRKTSAPSFSLEKERGGLCVKHSNFSGVFLRDWLLSYQSQSADGTQQIQDTWGPPRIKKAVWTSIQTHHSSFSWPSVEWMGGKFQLQLPPSPWRWKVGPCIQFSNFSGSYPRDWLLSHLSEDLAHSGPPGITENKGGNLN